MSGKGSNRVSPSPSSGATDSLSGEELGEYFQIFTTFDTDRSGEIDVFEMRAAMQELGFKQSERQTEEVIKEVDINRNGKVDFEEFVSCVQKITARTEEDNDVIDQCFQVFDQDKDGEISRAEFLSVLTGIGEFPEQTALKVFTEVDLTGNGRIDKAEFAQFVRNYLLEEGTEEDSDKSNILLALSKASNN